MKKLLKTIYLLSLICAAASSYSAQENNVKIRFGIFDENETFLANLQASDIQIIQGKKSVPIVSVKLETGNSLELLIMIDASASQERVLPDEKKAAEYIIDAILSKEKDKVAIVRFAGSVTLEQDLTDDFSKAKKQIGRIEFEPPLGYIGGGIVASQNLPPKNSDAYKVGSTSIWDSLKQILQSFSAVTASSARKAAILISDGVNTSGEAKLREAIESSIKTQIPIYAIGIGDDFYGGIDKKVLKKITEQTGGIASVPKKKLADLEQQAKKIKQSLRSNYEVVFTPNSANLRDSLQEVKIEIINPELRKRKLVILQPRGFFKK